MKEKGSRPIQMVKNSPMVPTENFYYWMKINTDEIERRGRMTHFKKAILDRDQIADNLKNYDRNSVNCPVCGGEPGDSWTGNFGDKTYNVRYSCGECDAPRYYVGYRFHSTSNPRPDYDCDHPRCPECGSGSSGEIEEEYVDGGVVITVSCEKCDCWWTEFYKFDGVTVTLDDCLIASDGNNAVRIIR